jgi:D-threo-aldose 1-dehydrogenase
MTAATLAPGQRRRLGRTPVEVTQLGFGAAPLGNMLAEVTDEAARAAVRAALDAGIGYFDTAPFYGHGLSEHRLGAALRECGAGPVVLSTKVGRVLRPARGATTVGPFASTLPFDAVHDYSYDATMRSLEDSLQRLGRGRVDIALIHDVTRKWRGERYEADYRLSVEGAFRALAELRAAGVIGAIGVGVNENDTLLRYGADADFDCFMLAGRYTLLDTSALDALLPDCVRRGISILLAAPYNSGILASGAVPGAKFWYADAPPEVLDRVRRMEALCARHGVALQAAATQFPLAHPALASVVVGCRDAVEVASAADACAAPIPRALWDELMAAGLLDPAAPVP